MRLMLARQIFMRRQYLDEANLLAILRSVAEAAPLHLARRRPLDPFAVKGDLPSLSVIRAEDRPEHISAPGAQEAGHPKYLASE